MADGYRTPRDRVTAWAFTMCVISEVWTASGGGEVGSRALDVTLLLNSRRW